MTSAAAAAMLCTLVAFVLFPAIPHGIHQIAFSDAVEPPVDTEALSPVMVAESPVVDDAPAGTPVPLPVAMPALDGQDEFVREWAKAFYTRAAPSPATVREQRVSEYQLSNGDTLFLLHEPVQRVSYSPSL